MVINIETKRLTMRQLSDEDWSLYYKLQTDSEIIDLCFDERSETDIKTGFDSRLPNWTIDSEHWLCLVIIEKESGNKVGTTGYSKVKINMDEQDRGLDKQGFIRNDYSSKNIQPEFKAVVDAVVSELCYRLPEQVDGIYLYGSVPRGNAIVGSSDLDVSIILTTPISQKEEQVFNELSAAIAIDYPEVSKLDIDPGDLNSVLESKEKYHWQFWLKHCCCCIWGNDLSARFSSYRPSIEIAQALNGDLSTFLEQMSVGYAGMSDANITKIIGKKLIRAAYYFVAAKDCSWYTDLFQCVEVAKRYYPVQSDDLELAYQYATGSLVSKTKATELYERLSQNIVSSKM